MVMVWPYIGNRDLFLDLTLSLKMLISETVPKTHGFDNLSNKKYKNVVGKVKIVASTGWLNLHTSVGRVHNEYVMLCAI